MTLWRLLWKVKASNKDTIMSRMLCHWTPRTISMASLSSPRRCGFLTRRTRVYPFLRTRSLPPAIQPQQDASWMW
jgi:hypothetical protein